jgi:ABC-type glycerol-3-phosphate transport system substrate-binding protein
VDQLGMYQQMIKDGTAFQDAKKFDDENDLANGKATFTFSSSASLPFYDKAIKDAGNKVHWNVALPPHGTGLQPATDMYGPNIAMFKSTPEKQLAAWLFIKYFTSKEVNPDWSVTTGYLPIRASGLGDPRVQQQIATQPQYAVAVQAQQYGRPEPNVAQWDPVRAAIQDAMVAAISDPSKNTKQLLDDAVNKANAALSR